MMDILKLKRDQYDANKNNNSRRFTWRRMVCRGRSWRLTANHGGRCRTAVGEALRVRDRGQVQMPRTVAARLVKLV